MSPLISVIVPVHNVGSHLEQCLRSVTDQTYSNLDIILVDDGSTDRSGKIAARYAAVDKRVRLFTQANQGVSSARNRGLAVAIGDYIAFVDADDWLEPTAYEQVVQAAITGDYDFVTFGYWVDDRSGSRPGTHLAQFEGSLDTEEGMQAVLLAHNRFVFTRLFRKSAIGAVRFREEFHWGEDTLFVLEVAARSTRSTTLPERLYHYVQSPGSATRSTVNPKRLTGVPMTFAMEELVRGTPKLVETVLRTRVNIIAILCADLRRSDDYDRLIESGLIRTLRRDLRRVLTARSIAPRTKAKALLVAISPAIYTRGLRVTRKESS